MAQAQGGRIFPRGHGGRVAVDGPQGPHHPGVADVDIDHSAHGQQAQARQHGGQQRQKAGLARLHFVQKVPAPAFAQCAHAAFELQGQAVQSRAAQHAPRAFRVRRAAFGPGLAHGAAHGGFRKVGELGCFVEQCANLIQNSRRQDKAFG